MPTGTYVITRGATDMLMAVHDTEAILMLYSDADDRQVLHLGYSPQTSVGAKITSITIYDL